MELLFGGSCFKFESCFVLKLMKFSSQLIQFLTGTFRIHFILDHLVVLFIGLQPNTVFESAEYSSNIVFHFSEFFFFAFLLQFSLQVINLASFLE